MINSFTMNGDLWRITEVDPDDYRLIDRTGTRTVATTNGQTFTICLSSSLTGLFKHHVLMHELGHVALISYNILNDIHRMVYPEYWIEMEELICNIIADYGYQIYDIASSYVEIIPQYIAA